MNQRPVNLWDPLIGDGRPLLILTGFLLVLSGLFALFQSATGHFLPHDTEYLGMSAGDLCRLNECRIVHFMFHDRVSFGGALIAIGLLYYWLAAFPLRDGEAWAWRVLVVSGIIGFGSFLLYIGYGYLDAWHGVATLGLLPCFLLGIIRSQRLIREDSRSKFAIRPFEWRTRAGLGRCLLFAAAVGILGAGLVIMTVGATRVFVPQDLDFMGITVEELRSINPRLIPLIAHDRAGFGGGLCCVSITLIGCLLFGQPSRALFQTLMIGGISGFGISILVHPIIGYTSFTHLLPAYTGATMYAVGLVLIYRDWK